MNIAMNTLTRPWHGTVAGYINSATVADLRRQVRRQQDVAFNARSERHIAQRQLRQLQEDIIPTAMTIAQSHGVDICMDAWEEYANKLGVPVPPQERDTRITLTITFDADVMWNSDDDYDENQMDSLMGEIVDTVRSISNHSRGVEVSVEEVEQI